MENINLAQGSAAWHAHRAAHFNASDAAAMLGCSPYKTRTQLIHEIATGVVPEVDPATQRRFDAGHAIEKAKREVAEGIIGEDLYASVGKLGKYSASFDGLTLLEETAWECKSLNDALRQALPNPGPDGNDAANLPKAYPVQMEHQCMVSGCERVLFTASDGKEDDRHCWYMPDPALRAELVAGWEQLERDVAAYEPATAQAAVVASPVETLPAVSVRMDGQLVVASNLPVFGTALRAFIDRMVPKPATDQEFADADAECKALKKAEEALEHAESGALAQLSDVEALRRTVADLRNLARSTRLAREKLVAAEKENRRSEIVKDGAAALAEHVDALDKRLGKAYMPRALAGADFAGAIRGKKNLDSMRDAVDTLLARSKILANETADRIQANLTHLREHAQEHAHLFADAAQLVHKAPDDLAAVVSSRIAAFVEQERAKEEATRERIRAEEAARLEREAAARRQQEERNAQAAADAAARAGREQAAQDQLTAQAGIAEGRATGALPGPMLDDLTAVAAHVHTGTVAGINAQAAIDTARRSTPSAAVPASADDGAANLLIGGINRRLGYDVNAVFLKQLGFEPARVDGARRFYRDSDLPRIGRAIAEHTLRVTQHAVPA